MVPSTTLAQHGTRGLPGRALVFLAVLSIGMSAFAHTRDTKHTERREIEQMEEQMRQAELAGDVGVVDRLLSDDFVGISMSGEVNTKTQRLDRMRSHALVLTGIHVDEVKIKLLGQVAVVTSRARIEGTSDGRSLAGTYRYTRVYLHAPGGAWKITNFEVTRISS